MLQNCTTVRKEHPAKAGGGANHNLWPMCIFSLGLAANCFHISLVIELPPLTCRHAMYRVYPQRFIGLIENSSEGGACARGALQPPPPPPPKGGGGGQKAAEVRAIPVLWMGGGGGSGGGPPPPPPPPLQKGGQVQKGGAVVAIPSIMVDRAWGPPLG